MIGGFKEITNATFQESICKKVMSVKVKIIGCSFTPNCLAFTSVKVAHTGIPKTTTPFT